MNYNTLKEAIKRSKLQRKEIAERSNITPKTIDNILAGGDPKVSTLEAIANVIGIKVGLLFDEEQSSVRTEGNYSPAAFQGSVSMSVGDTILLEKVKHLEELLKEKDERIADLKERIADLKQI